MSDHPPLPVRSALPIQSLEQLCLHLNMDGEALDELVASMSRQFHKYSQQSKSSSKVRIIYNPGEPLRAAQTSLRRLLDQIPLPDAAHGWRKGRSPSTNARAHVGKALLIKLDLEDFFPSCHFTRVHQLFLDLGCSQEVARALTRLTTADHHLPQGFLTSPVLANLLLAPLDRRLRGLVRQRGADYSRYGDDLSLSGQASLLKAGPLAKRIISESGHRINAEKFARNGVRFAYERQEVCAITVNKKLNLRKPDYQRYQAILGNCIRNGPSSELREGETWLHLKRRLQGYINYVRGINREAASQLQNDFDQILWTLAPGLGSSISKG